MSLGNSTGKECPGYSRARYSPISDSVKKSNNTSRHTPRACRSGLTFKKGCLLSNMSEGLYVVTINTFNEPSLPPRKFNKSTVEASAQCKSSKNRINGRDSHVA